jgi:hypothetical protein
VNTVVIKKGTKGDPIVFPITDINGNVKDLSGLTATLKAWNPGDPETLIIDALCSTGADPTLGICTYTPVAGELDDNNVRYQAEIELTETGVIIGTETFKIVVEESG